MMSFDGLKTKNIFITAFLCVTLTIHLDAAKSRSPHQCISIHKVDFNECSAKSHLKVHTQNNSKSCPNKDVCRNVFNILEIDMYPFTLAMIISKYQMIQHCCPKCGVKYNITTIAGLPMANLSLLNKVDMIYPVFARASTSKMYDFWFLPIMDAPSSYYVTKRFTTTDFFHKLLDSVSTLWPLLCMTILIALLSGFAIWLIDTWYNETDFPRNYIIGLLSGFWWAFVTMTTVGYGDLTPKSQLGRMFAIIWILVGLTVCSLLTATMTNMVSIASVVTDSDMNGKKIGVLKHRMYEAVVIAKHGGVTYVVDDHNVITGTAKLVEMLFSQEIDGILLDRNSLYFYWSRNNDAKLNQTVFTEKFLHNDKYYYGMLIREKLEYDYFSKFIEDNWFQIDSCFTLKINMISSELYSEAPQFKFPPKDGIENPWIIFTITALGFLVLFGILYELLRRVYLKNDCLTLESQKDGEKKNNGYTYQNKIFS